MTVDAHSENLARVLAELREIRKLLELPSPRADDLVPASYIAARTGLAERTILESKAGTEKLTRVALGKLIRFQRAEVDRWIRQTYADARAATPQQRAAKLAGKLERKRRNAA